LLASQGFTVARLNIGESMEGNQRKEEVDAFLGELESNMSTLNKKQQILCMNIGNALQIYQE
jgi:hypothetical protein